MNSLVISKMYDRQPLAYYPSTGSLFDMPVSIDEKVGMRMERQESFSSVLNLLIDLEPLPFQSDSMKIELPKEDKLIPQQLSSQDLLEDDTIDWLSSEAENLEASYCKTERIQNCYKTEQIQNDGYTWCGKRKNSGSDGSDDERKKGKWSKEEDLILRQFASEAQSKNRKIDFKRVCKKLRGRTPKQVREHWLSTLNPDLKKGRWTREEELQLIDLMIIHGKAWSTIARKIEGRAEHSVKAKGRLLLGERIKAQIHPLPAAQPVKPQRLMELHRQYGSHFEEISRQVGYAMSPAKIEREILHMCSCTSCSKMTELIKSSRSPDLHHGWTRIKAKQIKEKILNSHGRYLDDDIY